MSLLAAIHKVRSQNISLVKTGEVRGKFKFASYFDVMEALQGPLRDAGLSVGFPAAKLHEVQTVNGPTEYVTVTLEVSDGVDRAVAEYDVLLPEAIRNQQGSAVTNSAQRTANAITYAKRIGLLAFWNLAAGDEDDVERMTPGPGQSSIPGQVILTADTTWESLTDGLWRMVSPPSGDGLLRDYREKHGASAMYELWGLHPDHPGLCAWGYDALNREMTTKGIQDWAGVVQLNGSLPSVASNCTGKQLRDAWASVRLIPKPETQKP